MTQFAAGAPEVHNPRAAYVDGLIALNRAANPVPQVYLQRRDRDRLTSSEINQMDEQAVGSGMRAPSVHDLRTPTERFLDILDLPRNAMANIAFGEPDAPTIAGGLGSAAAWGALFGGIAGTALGPAGTIAGALEGAAWAGGGAAAMYGAGAAARPLLTSESDRRRIVARARQGTFGAPQVYSSDVLERLGVENNVTRAVLGFAGDVLLDPTTYLSGGGNVVTKIGSDGSRAVFNKGGARMVSQIVRHVQQTGALPVDPQLSRLNHLFETSIKIGDEMHVVKGTAADLGTYREAIASGIDKLRNSALSPEEVAQVTDDLNLARRRLKATMDREIVDLLTTDPTIGPVERFRGQVARDFAREYAARSSHQAMLPFSSLVVDRLPGYRSGNLPFGGFGEPGRLHRFLRGSEAELVGARDAQYAKAVKELRDASRTLSRGGRLSIPASAVPTMDEAMRSAAVTDASGMIHVPLRAIDDPHRVESLVREGWKLNRPNLPVHHWAAVQRELDRVDHVRRESKRVSLTEKVRSLKAREQAAAEAFDEARFQVDISAAVAPDSIVQKAQDELRAAHVARSRAEEQLADVATAPKLAIEDSLDSMHASFKEGDAALAAVGPYAAVRKGAERLFGRHGPQRYRDLEMQRSKIADANAFAQRLLDIENQRLAARLAAGGRFAGEAVADAREAEALSMRVAAGRAADAIDQLRSFEGSLPTTVTPRPVLSIPKGTPRDVANQIRAVHRQAIDDWKAGNSLSTAVELPLEPIPSYVTSSDRQVVPPRVNERRAMSGRDASQTPLLRAVAAGWGTFTGGRPDEWFDRANAPGGVLLDQAARAMGAASTAPTYEGFAETVATELVRQTMGSHRRRIHQIGATLRIPVGNTDRLAEGIGAWVGRAVASGTDPETGTPAIDAVLRRLIASVGDTWQELHRAGGIDPASGQVAGFVRVHGDPVSLVGGSMSLTSTGIRRAGEDMGSVVRHTIRVPEGRSAALRPEPPLFGSIDLPKARDRRVSNKGRSTSMDLQFTNDVDRALYEAGRRIPAKDTEGLARQQSAVDYLRRQLGINARQARRQGRSLIADIERQVFGFSPTLEAAVRRASPAGDRRVYLHGGDLVSANDLRAAGVNPSEAELVPQLLTPSDYVVIQPARVQAPRTRDGLAAGTFGRSVGHMEGDRHFVVGTSRWARKRIAAASGLRFEYKASQPGSMLPWDMTRRSRENLAYMTRISEGIADQASFAGAEAESVAHLAETVAKGRAAAEESAATAAALLKPIDDEIRAIEEKRPFRWLQSLNETMRRSRTAFNLNSDRRMKQLARRYGFESEDQARIAKARAVNHINKMVVASIKETGVEPKSLKQAMTHRVFEIAVAQDERGVVGPLRDDILHRIAAENSDAFAKLRSDPGFEQVAQHIWRTFNDWQQIETGLGLLPDDLPRLAYIPIGFTEGARASHVDSLRRLGEAVPAGATGRLSTNPRFGLRRATNRILWGPENEELILKLATRADKGALSPAIQELLARAHVDRDHWVWSGELNAHNVNDDSWAFERWRRDFLRRQRNAGNDLMTAGDRHLLGLPGGDASVAPWMPEEFPTSPQMLNYMRDDFLKSGASILAETVFEEDILTNFARRMGQHLEARASARFAEEIAPYVKLRTRDEVAAMQRGASKGTVVIDGLEYRPVKRELISKMRLRFPISEDVIDHYYWPVALADDVEDMARKLSSDADLTGMFRGIQVVQNWWKAAQLFASPAWWTSNMISGGLMSWLIGGSRPSRWPALAPLAMSIVNDVKRGGTRIDRRMFDLKGTMISGRDLKELLVLGGVASAGRSMMEIPNILRTGADSSGLLGKLMQGSRLGKFYGGWFQFNASTDDLWRVMTALDLIEQGNSLDHAVDMARRAHVDFSDFSYAEQKWGTLVWPFYRWMKGNMSLQVRHFLDNPSYGAAFPKLRHAIDEAIQSEDELPLELQPTWLRDNVGVQIGAHPSMRFALLKTLTPAQELFEAGVATMGGDGFFEFLKYVTSSANPLLKALPEIATQREIYSGRPLGNDVPGGIPWADYLLNQLGPWRRGASIADRVNRGINDWPAEIARIALGGSRLHITTPEDVSRQFEFNAVEAGDSLRSRIKSARRRGDTEDATRLAGEMVDHYRRLWELGYVDMVPRSFRPRFREETARRREVGAEA